MKKIKSLICLTITMTLLLGLYIQCFASQTPTIKVEKITNSTAVTATNKEQRNAQRVAYIKQQLLSHSFSTDKETEAVIRQGLKDCHITMSEKEIKKAVKLMSKIRSMGYDPKDIADQVDSIYSKNKAAIDNGSFSISDLGIDDLDTGKLAKKTLGIAAKGIVKTVKEFVKDIFR